MMAPYATHWFDDASVGKNDWWMLLDPIGEGENASVARFQGGFAAGSCFFGLNSDNFCNYSAMPPAGRFLKKAPQKLSGCNPFCSLGRIPVGKSIPANEPISTSKPVCPTFQKFGPRQGRRRQY